MVLLAKVAGDGNVWVLDVVYQHKLIDGILLLVTDIL